MTIPLWLTSSRDHDDSTSSDTSARAHDRQVRAARLLKNEGRDPLAEPDFATRLRDGDPQAFDELFLATYPGLVRFATRLTRSLDTAEDLVMEVFRRVWERRASWAPDDVRVYLYGAVRNIAATAARDVATRRALLSKANAVSPGMASPAVGADISLEDADRLDALTRAIDVLPERQRLVFTLRRERGLSNADVAAVLGIAVKTVEKDLTAAFKTLRGALVPFRDTL